MPDKPKPVSPPWRSFLRFSVRGLILFVLAAGAWLGWVVRNAHIQRDAVAEIKNAGGGAAYDWQWWDGQFIPRRKSWASRWLADLIGVDFFGHVTNVWISSESTRANPVMVYVGRLTRLQRLDVTGSCLGDDGMMHLNGLTNLSELHLTFTQVTDAGLAHLKGLTNLSALHLLGTRVTYAGINELKHALPNVKISRF